MPPKTTILAVLGLALLLAAPSLAKAPHAHAGDPGPPAHTQAAAGDEGPPGHAEAASAGPGPPDDAGARQPATDADGVEDAEPDTSASPDPEPVPEPALETDEAHRPAPTGAIATTERPETRTSVAATPTAAAPTAPDPQPNGASSSTASGGSGTFRLYGPAIVVGLLGVGLVARARTPAEEASEATETTDTAGPDEDPEREPDAADPEPPTPGPVGLLTLGHRALERGDVEQAADWFRTATLAAPDRQTAHFCLGLCLAELDRLQAAEAALAEARRLRPGDLEATYAHAQVLAGQARTRPALRLLERLADEMPGLDERLRQDEAWTGLHDHPRWLALAGQLPDTSPSSGPAGEPPA